MNQHEIARIVELTEAAAYADMLSAVPADRAAAFGVRVERIAGAVALVMAKVPILLFNRIIGLGLTEPATETMVEHCLDLYRRAGVEPAVQLSPAAQPPQLTEWLKAKGLREHGGWAKFYREPTPPPDIKTDLRIEAIGTERADDFATVLLAAFGMPPTMHWLGTVTVGRANWRHYIGYDGDQPVTIGALFVHDGIAALQMGGTLPSHRGRGGQGAIMARRIADAIALGCRWITTETGDETPEQPNPSYHNMIRTGFQLAYVRPNYIAAR